MRQDIVRTQVRIPNDIYTRAKELSETKGVSFNQLVIKALIYFDQKEKTSSPTKVKEALDLISHVVGMKL